MDITRWKIIHRNGYKVMKDYVEMHGEKKIEDRPWMEVGTTNDRIL